MIGLTSSIEKHNPVNAVNLVPIMSSNNNGTIEIFASSIYSPDPTNRGPWTSFDGITNNDYGWHTASSFSYPQWLGFYHSSKKSKVTHINIYNRNGFPNRVPGTWSLQGSNDKTNWYTIQSYTNSSTAKISVDVNQYNEWYYHYRIHIQAAAGGDAINICELQFMGYYQ